MNRVNGGIALLYCAVAVSRSRPGATARIPSHRSATARATRRTALFKEHLDTIGARWTQALGFAGFDAAIVTAGEPRNYFLDDQAPPVRLNPHFLQICPSTTAIGSALLLRPGQAPRLFFLRPEDYWHQPPEIPKWASHYDVETFADAEALNSAVRRAALSAGNHVAIVGESGPDAVEGFESQDVNPPLLLNHLHFQRALKTEFELHCMRAATRKAVAGHVAARRAFQAGASEFEINLAYLAASRQTADELPYHNIVAINEHAGVLHYQHYDRSPPGTLNSFLIDAGGSEHGYAADVTRTYAGTVGGAGRALFSELVDRLDAEQRALCGSIAGGVSFVDLHVDMHRRIAGILCDTGVTRGSPEAVFECGLTEVFLPHGLGHLIGLQTHDVGGQQRAPEGGTEPPPENYAALRTTRSLQDDMPVTIEPGIYFIPQLLDAAQAGPHAALVDWAHVTALRPFGGIRIEDNVVLRGGRLENLTRDAFAELESGAGATSGR